jgi:hypothetical protein
MKCLDEYCVASLSSASILEALCAVSKTDQGHCNNFTARSIVVNERICIAIYIDPTAATKVLYYIKHPHSFCQLLSFYFVFGYRLNIDLFVLVLR